MEAPKGTRTLKRINKLDHGLYAVFRVRPPAPRPERNHLRETISY